MASKASGKRHAGLRRTVLAFVVTLAALGLGYGALVAINSRVALDILSSPAVAAGESHAVATAAALLAPGVVGANAPEDDLPFVPSGRRMRERRVRDGTAQAAARFVMLAAPARGRADSALVDARLAIANGAELGDAERVVARDALLRLNARIGTKKASLDTSAAALAAMMRAAADACEGEERALAELSATPTLLAAPATEARMFEARGVAYGWLMLVRAALLDAPTLADATAVEAAIPVEALQHIVERQPLIMFNGDKSSPWAPAHVTDTAADFTRAAIGARALASALERQAN